MKKKKILVMVICVSLILPNLELLRGFAEEQINQYQLDEEGYTKDISAPIPTEAVTFAGNKVGQEEQLRLDVPDEINTLYEGNVKLYNQSDLVDGSNPDYVIGSFTGEDIEAHMLSGHSVEDIFRAYDLSHEINYDAKELLERKINQSGDWTSVVNSVEGERTQIALSGLASLYPDEAQLLQMQGVGDDAKLQSLITVDKNLSEVNLDINGVNLNENAINSSSITVTSESLNELELSQADVEGLSDAIFNKLKFVSNATGKPLNIVIQEYKANLGIMNVEGEKM